MYLLYSKRYVFISITASILFFTACGGGGGGSTTEIVLDNSSNTITVTSCENYIIINDGDSLVKDTTDTVVKIIHDSNNVKKVCVVSGSAHIVRN